MHVPIISRLHTPSAHHTARFTRHPCRPARPWHITPLLLLALAMMWTTDLSAQPLRNAQADALVRRGIELSGRQNYTKAREAFDELAALLPSHPAGPFFKAVLMQVISLDFELPVSSEYLRLLERTEALAEAMVKADERNAEARFYLGMAKSYIAYYKFRDGENWVSGLTNGLSAYSTLKECLELNPKAYDAMTAVGTYRYWKSRKASFLTWTPFVDDDRQAGIDQLRMAEQRGSYTNQQASNSLVWIYIEEERHADAIRTAEGVLKQFPNNRLFLWGLASAAERRQDWKLARSAYQRILQSMDSEVIDRRYIEIQARAKVAQTSFSMGDKVTAKRECLRVLMKKGMSLAGLGPDGTERIRKRFAEMEKLRMALL